MDFKVLKIFLKALNKRKLMLLICNVPLAGILVLLQMLGIRRTCRWVALIYICTNTKKRNHLNPPLFLPNSLQLLELVSSHRAIAVHA